MGRQKCFVREEVLDRAIDVFRKKGYEATSIQELVGAMGINRFTIYEEFTDKHGLFLESLDRYQKLRRDQVRLMFAQPGPRLPILRAYLESIVTDTLSGGPSGCLVVNSALELAKGDPEIAEVAHNHFNLLEEMFLQAMIQAKENGEIETGRDLRALTRFFLNTARGMRVVVSYTRDPAVMADIIDVALSTLHSDVKKA
jgi:TetR/AcrR family transcriptional repressor of nem operon